MIVISSIYIHNYHIAKMKFYTSSQIDKRTNPAWKKRIKYLYFYVLS